MTGLIHTLISMEMKEILAFIAFSIILGSLFYTGFKIGVWLAKKIRR